MLTETVVKKLEKERGTAMLDNVPLRLLVILLLLTIAPLYESHHITAFSNGDIWWHLRTGLWILQNHSIPHQGLFSQFPEKTWVASNWGFDALAAFVYKLIGLRAIPSILMAFKLGLAAITFLLAYIGQKRFWPAVLLSAAAQYVVVGLQPLPILFSILFFGIELVLLLQSRRSGDVRPLFWLPLLFACWANLHEEFVLGILLLGIFIVVGATEQLLHNVGINGVGRPSVPVSKSLAVAAISCAATLLTPYTFRLFPTIMPTLYSPAGIESFAEMMSMEFRRPQNFVLLILVMGAFFVLGRERSRDLFKLSVLCIFAMLSFRFQRDAWCVVLPSIAVLADWQSHHQVDVQSHRRPRDWRRGIPILATTIVIAFSVAILRMPSNSELEKSTQQVFPLNACDYIRTNHLPGPIFNSYSWGGYLTFFLPEYPVAIDGRLSFYGDEANETYFKVTAGTSRLEDDPSFVGARTILIERNSGMATALTSLPQLREQFHVAYKDDLAIVLVRTSPSE
jgi:hypothetical protein